MVLLMKQHKTLLVQIIFRIKYVHSTEKLIDIELNRTYIAHNELMSGGNLTLEMGAEPNNNWPNN